jgi:hypothetical protein
MSKRGMVVISTALIFGTALAAPARAAGSDVVQYPKAEAAMGQHYDMGIPVPRVRAFVKAPWTDATSRAPGTCSYRLTQPDTDCR